MADKVAVDWRSVDELRLVRIRFELNYNLAKDANAGMREWDGRVASVDFEVEPDVDVSLLGSGR